MAEFLVRPILPEGEKKERQREAAALSISFAECAETRRSFVSRARQPSLQRDGRDRYRLPPHANTSRSGEPNLSPPRAGFPRDSVCGTTASLTLRCVRCQPGKAARPRR